MSHDDYSPDYYRRLQEGYTAGKAWVWKRIALVLAGLRPGPADTVLETGCGQGTLARELATRARRVYAVDRSPEAIAACRRFLAEQGMPGAVRIVQADLEALPFRAGSFGKVNFSEVVEHLDRPLPVLQELYRVLAPGGALMVTTWPNRAHLIWNWRYRHGRGSPEDFNPQTPRSLGGLLRAARFQVVETRLSNFYLHLPRTRWTIDGCMQETPLARFCERVLTRRPWGDYLAASINMLCRKESL